MKEKLWTIFLFLILIAGLTFCSNRQIKYITNEGKFLGLSTEIETISYIAKSNSNFYATLELEISAGKVDWEIVDPKNKVVYKGYLINENDRVYKELTYPINHQYQHLNTRQEVKSDTNQSGKAVYITYFNGLEFNVDKNVGEYKLLLMPTGAEGSYKIEWSNGLPRK